MSRETASSRAQAALRMMFGYSGLPQDIPAHIGFIDAVEEMIAVGLVDCNLAAFHASLDDERRFQAAKAAMQGLLAAGERHRGHSDEDDAHVAARVATIFADALLAELAKTRGPV